MSNVLPKEKQTAYERWEMASFGDDRSGGAPHSASHAATPRRSDEEIDQLRAEAKLSGHAAGFAEGRAAGLEAGRDDIAREITNFQQLASSFCSEAEKANNSISQDILSLALDLTKAMLKSSLEIRPEVMLPVIAEAIRYLPSLQQPALLHLNPQDAVIVRDHMGDELTQSGWRVAEDRQITRGGCRIDTASNQIDATVETRWHRITEALGRDSSWLV